MLVVVVVVAVTAAVAVVAVVVAVAAAVLVVPPALFKTVFTFSSICGQCFKTFYGRKFS